jgi:hypothetical protein
VSDLAYRYGMPGRTNRLVAGVLVAALVVGGFGFLGWTVLVHGNPQVQSQVNAYAVVSDHEVQASLQVLRQDPTTPALCRLQAVAADHAVVGELTQPVTDGPRDQTLRLTIRTERRATTVTSSGCTTPDQPRPR